MTDSKQLYFRLLSYVRPYAKVFAVADGKLVKLFDTTLPLTNAYWFVCLEHMADAPRIKAMREWLIADVSRKKGEAA